MRGLRRWTRKATEGGAPGAPPPRDVAIREDTIRLGQLLKLADLVDAGGEVKALLASGEVLVNGQPETRRGRQLTKGDVVEHGGQSVRVT